TSVSVTKVDSVAPTISTSGNPKEWTKSAKISAKFSDALSGIKTKQYSLDNKTWKTYSSSITVKQNCTVYFKATDKAGNKTTKSVSVTKVDSVAPTISISGNPKEWTTSAKISAKMTDDLSGIKTKQYSLDNKTWKTYSSSITVKKNCTVYFKATDKAGNVKKTSVKVTKIGNGDNSNDTWQNATPLAGNSVSGWVGAGDLADYYKFSTTKKAQLTFDFDAATTKAVKNGTLDVVCLDADGKKVSLVWNGAKQDYLSKSKLAAGTYILGVTDPVGQKTGLDYKITIGK
ncbi:MAG: hypothetical protein MJ016_08075, partial [Victivallaceae bacterium]|nr:hypothetical protein [Victivallaceae bacterium]